MASNLEIFKFLDTNVETNTLSYPNGISRIIGCAFIINKRFQDDVNITCDQYNTNMITNVKVTYEDRKLAYGYFKGILKENKTNSIRNTTIRFTYNELNLYLNISQGPKLSVSISNLSWINKTETENYKSPRQISLYKNTSIELFAKSYGIIDNVIKGILPEVSVIPSWLTCTITEQDKVKQIYKLTVKSDNSNNGDYEFGILKIIIPGSDSEIYLEIFKINTTKTTVDISEESENFSLPGVIYSERSTDENNRGYFTNFEITELPDFIATGARTNGRKIDNGLSLYMKDLNYSGQTKSGILTLSQINTKNKIFLTVRQKSVASWFYIEGYDYEEEIVSNESSDAHVKTYKIYSYSQVYKSGKWEIKLYPLRINIAEGSEFVSINQSDIIAHDKYYEVPIEFAKSTVGARNYVISFNNSSSAKTLIIKGTQESNSSYIGVKEQNDNTYSSSITVEIGKSDIINLDIESIYNGNFTSWEWNTPEEVEDYTVYMDLTVDKGDENNSRAVKDKTPVVKLSRTQNTLKLEGLNNANEDNTSFSIELSQTNNASVTARVNVLLKVTPYNFYFKDNQDKGLSESSPFVLAEINNNKTTEGSISLVSTNENNVNIPWEAKPNDDQDIEGDLFYDNSVWSVKPDPNNGEFGNNGDSLVIKPLAEYWDKTKDNILDLVVSQSYSGKNLYARFIQKRPDFNLTSDKVSNNTHSIKIKSGESGSITFTSTLNGESFPIKELQSQTGIFDIKVDANNKFKYTITGTATSTTTTTLTVVQDDGNHEGNSIQVNVTIEAPSTES